MRELTKSQLNRRREMEILDAGGQRMPCGMLPPNAAAALQRLLGRHWGRSQNAVIAKALVLADELATKAEARAARVDA